jgi:iron complex outermembrane receptor protein
LSDGADIGKSNSDFPARTTVYPRDRHVFASFSRTGAPFGRISAWGHYQSLHTKVRANHETSGVRASVMDYGFRYAREVPSGKALDVIWGADLYGRFDYDVVEDAQTTLRNGRETELGAYADLRRTFDAWTLGLGARFVHLDSRADGVANFDNSDVIGRASVAWRAPRALHFEISANRSITYPTLAQLHFTGTTPRGTVVGNAALAPEMARTFEFTASWQPRGASMHVNAFDMDLDGFINKVELAPNVETFFNGASGRIRGLIVNASVVLGVLAVGAGYSRIRGESDSGNPMRDIPNDELKLSLHWQLSASHAALTVRHRFESNRVARSNIQADRRTLIDAAYRFRVGAPIEIELVVRNLLNETYWVTNDRKSPLGAERSFGLGVIVEL